MSTPCDPLQSFADGELPPAEAQAFGRHLAECERCQAELTRLLQLEQAGRRYLERHGPVHVPWHAVPRNRWLAAAGAAVVSVAAVLLLSLGPAGSPASRPEPALWAVQQRTQEARVTYRAADTWRSLVQPLMGAAPASGASGASHATLGELEARGDLSQLSAVYLTSAQPDFTRAKPLLEQMRRARPADVDVLCDLGVAYYSEARSLDASRATAKLREALQLFNEVLRRKPAHSQARWNRALVYRDLGLPLSAMQDFAALERTEPDAGWKNEARDKQNRLAVALQRKERWLAADTAGLELISRGAAALTEALVYADVPLMRRDFYHAVRARTSSEDVRALLPLASRLDEISGGTVLADYVGRIAGRDFSVRAPLAAQYARLAVGQVPEREQEALLQTFLASGEDDIAVGALTIVAPRLTKYAGELVARTQDSPDPWFRVLGLQTDATREQAQDHYARAQKLLEEALDLCKREQLVFRCIEVENDLSHVAGWFFHVTDAERHARDGLAMARQAQWDQERMLLQTLGNAARMAADVTLGRAYFGEALLMAEDDPKSRRNIHQNLAHLAIQALELDEARAALDRSMAVGLPLTQHGVAALVDVARTRRSPQDAAAVEQALAQEPGNTPAQRAYAKFLQGRFLVEVDAVKGRALLEEAIREAGAAPPEVITARHARAYSYTSLIFADAAKGDFAAALGRFATELGFEAPTRCVLALTEDTERSLLVARGSEGQLLSLYTPVRAARFSPTSLAGVVPQDMVEALRPCASVDVLARPPLQGRAGLLPPELAWRYRTRAASPRPPDGPGVHLVVRDVRYGEKRSEVALTWSPRVASGTEPRTLRDLDATPGRVLTAMPEAAEIDLATHGKMDPGSNMAYLLLAPGPDGRDELYEDRIRKLALPNAPLVVLAACEAARGTSALHEHGSLPNAFLAAGARTVLAATHPIPNVDAAAFLGDVRERIRAGASASEATRDERLEWLGRGADAGWVNSVLVFE